MNLGLLYQIFLREIIDKKWLMQFKYLTVLGERFIDGYYIVVFEVDDSQELIDEVFGK